MPWRRNSPPSSRSSPNCSQQLAAARKDSSTSSKPPSSDIVKPPKPPPPEGQDRRRIGGQPGHPKHERAAFPPEVDQRRVLRLSPRLSAPAAAMTCSPCRPIAPRVVQQVDIHEVPLSIQEHRSHPGWCPHCQKMYEAPLPVGDRARRPGRAAPDHPDRLPQGGLPRLVLDRPQVPPRRRRGDDLARANWPRSSPRSARRWSGPMRNCSTICPDQARLNVDETGHKQNGQRHVDLVLPGRAVHAVQDRPDPQCATC